MTGCRQHTRSDRPVEVSFWLKADVRTSDRHFN
jgi:hypothetical protein